MNYMLHHINHHTGIGDGNGIEFKKMRISNFENLVVCLCCENTLSKKNT